MFNVLNARNLGSRSLVLRVEFVPESARLVLPERKMVIRATTRELARCALYRSLPKVYLDCFAVSIGFDIASSLGRPPNCTRGSA
jgi:hypothetical protein